MTFRIRFTLGVLDDEPKDERSDRTADDEQDLAAQGGNTLAGSLESSIPITDDGRDKQQHNDPEDRVIDQKIQNPLVHFDSLMDG